MSYLIESGLISLFLSLGYFLLLRQTTAFDLRRTYILSIIMGSLLIPLMPRISNTQIEVFSVVLNPVIISAQSASGILESQVAQSITLRSLFIGLYLLITILMVGRFFINVSSLFRRIKMSPILEERSDYQVLQTETKQPFSFLKYIFIPSHIDYSSKKCRTIIEHELSHVRSRHSLDLILISIVRCLFWWNPVYYWLSKEVQLVHEYQVDTKILTTLDKKTYITLLTSFHLLGKRHALVNTISSQLKSRIKMMYNTKQTHPTFLIKTLTLLIFAGAIALHSCSSEDQTIVSTMEEKVEPSNYYEKTVVDTIITFDTETYKEDVTIVESKMKVFKEPDQMPWFPGCESENDLERKKECSNQKLMTYIFENLNYPEEAREEAVEGMVVVSFIVDSDGWVTFEKIIKSLSKECDAEVLRMIGQMRKDQIKFEPGLMDGEKVSVEYTLPVRFKLQ